MAKPMLNYWTDNPKHTKPVGVTLHNLVVEKQINLIRSHSLYIHERRFIHNIKTDRPPHILVSQRQYRRTGIIQLKSRPVDILQEFLGLPYRA